MPETLRRLIDGWGPPAYRSVELQRVRVFYGAQPVLTDINLRFEAGTATAVMGANGAGKSTVLNALSTLLPIDAGDIIAGDKIRYRDHLSILRPTIGLVAHEPMLYHDLSAVENLRLWAQLYDRRDADIDGWLRAMDLAHAKDRPVGGFSRGMKQRLAVARAMLHEPTLLLLDEVLTGLDYASRRQIWMLLEALRANDRIVVLATHVFDHPVSSVCRGVVLRGGREVADAHADEGLLELYAAHATRRRRSEAAAP